ncbi:uncharacterized protein LOC129766908 [Toxorhynchites rutilus septentrionalis]|uniref:uncharacterized protein LOC129766908 n=1 Tax=Toxorhynchites rutilus septentrionalis TaxID=329112 RepID=UPI002479BBBD|nr:uncharacterized protein LOC129766908 [Toxorhynchites rutilus septentrionalis]
MKEHPLRNTESCFKSSPPFVWVSAVHFKPEGTFLTFSHMAEHTVRCEGALSQIPSFFFNIATKCRRKGLVQKFISIKPSITSEASEKAANSAKKIWLAEEIKFKHKQVSMANYILSICNYLKKASTILPPSRKLEDAQGLRETSGPPQAIENFVVNLSSTQFTQPEFDLLNRGLNYAVSPQRAPLSDIVNNIESAIQYDQQGYKSATRYNVKQCVLRAAEKQNNIIERPNFETWCTIRMLKSRDVIYSRADKGNAVVIMDKKDYDSRVLDIIDAGPYEECKFKNGKQKDPLNGMIEEANSVRHNVARLMGEDKLERKFHVPNPMVALLYCLPKIHKNPVGMRPISSNIRTPTEKMAGWLVEEMKEYPVTHGKSVKNSVDFVKQLEGFKVRRGEILVSFDVAALFPSVPVVEALKSLRRHLERSRAPHHHIEAYLLVSEVCMRQNFFTFRGKMYKQTFGLSMGSKLSPLLANVFMSNFEVEIAKEKLFPRTWRRYVDDIFTSVKERYLGKTLDMLNSRHDSITFTCEKEVDGKLPFLDLEITRKEDNTLKFGIYRKPTSIDRFITSDSNHFGAQKQATFHSMAHRLYNVPMEEEEFAKEEENIYKAATVNGYGKEFVERILRKHKRKKYLLDITTLQPEIDDIKRITLPFYPKITNPIKKTLKKQALHIVYKSENTLRDLLCNLKDKISPDEQSGIYEIPCRDCPAVYIGQTRRKVKVRIREHRTAVDNSKPNDSAVAVHTTSLDHNIDWTKAKLIKYVRKSTQLNAWESMFISNSQKPLMNEDDPPITSCLFNLTELRI